jgi:hypothetical protein
VSFTAESGRAVSAVTGMHEDSDSVEEHGSILARRARVSDFERLKVSQGRARAQSPVAIAIVTY